MDKCLYCYKPLSEGEKDYHKKCARKIFDSNVVPELPYTRNNIKELAKKIVTASTTITGVQAKLSLDIARGVNGEPQRFTIVGLWGRFILKPQTDKFPNLPENEDLIMHLAEEVGIKTVPHSLMHLKNFSLFKPSANYMLTPAYDLLSTSIVMPEDKEELALTLNGKKKKIKREDFEKAMRDSGMEDKSIANVFTKFSKVLPKWTEIINESFLPVEKREELQALISRMATRVGLTGSLSS